MCDRVRAGKPLRPPVSGALLTALCASLVLIPRPLEAQWPGEVVGEVVDASTGSPVESATVFLAERVVATDAAGRFRVTRVLAGSHAVRVARVGYADAVETIEVRNGEATHIRVWLTVAPVPLAALRVSATLPIRTSALTLDRARIERSVARDAAELLAEMPGLVVRSDGAGGPATVSIRGGTAGSVLVLVDGAPINDRVVGAADLSRIAAHRIESIVVLPGAQSPLYGPGAESGVVLIETRLPSDPLNVRVELGSLGETGISAERGIAGGERAFALGGSLRRLDGVFDYRVPPEAGGGGGQRRNADVRVAGVHASARARLGGGAGEARLSADAIERGVPGRSFAVTPHARQDATRLAASARWRRNDGDAATVATWSAATDRAGFTDTLPPYGPAIHERSDIAATSLRVERQRTSTRLIRRHSAGAEAQLLRIRSTSLERGRNERTAALFASGAAVIPALARLELELALRVDLHSVAGTHGSHAATLAWDAGALRTHVAHRSAFTPPSAADQLFREGVGVAPNPHLRAERVPAELEAGARIAGRLGVLDAGAGATLYRAHVRDMIVWAPDFRFVWSPTNVDVHRRGGELWADVRHPVGLGLRGGYAHSAVTYDGPTGPDTIQLAYRPRHSAHIVAQLERGAWSAELRGRYTGVRYPAPGRVNPLGAFWTWDAVLAREAILHGWHALASLRLERLFDERDSLIFGYPEPGRVLRASVTLRPHARPQP